MGRAEGQKGAWFHVRTDPSDDERSHTLPSMYSSWSNLEVTVLHASAGHLLNLPLTDLNIPCLAWFTNSDHRVAVIRAAVKALLKEGGETGAWDPGVQFHWQQGRREKRRKEWWERKPILLTQMVLSSRETIFYVVPRGSISRHLHPGHRSERMTTEVTEVRGSVHQPELQKAFGTILISLCISSLAQQHGKAPVDKYLSTQQADSSQLAH